MGNETLSLANNCARECVQTIRIFLVAADAPGSAAEPLSCREAISENIRSYGAWQYLWPELTRSRIARLWDGISPAISQLFASRPRDMQYSLCFSRSYHHAVWEVLNALREDVQTIIWKHGQQEWPSSFSREDAAQTAWAAHADEVAGMAAVQEHVLKYVNDDWPHRRINLVEFERFIHDEYTAGARQTGVAAPSEAPDIVTLDQMAALVKRSKKTLENLKKRPVNPLPAPDVKARKRGQTDGWIWQNVRAWLEAEFGHGLPEYTPLRK